MGMYGANITRDDTGQVLIVSFAQAGASRSDATQSIWLLKELFLRQMRK